LTDLTNPANESDTLSLARGSTASGVGIQVLSGTTVIKYGPDSAAAGNTNQWQAGSTGNGTFNIPLTARYVQTGPKVTAGSANGLVTFTMNYQ
jgi:type 1 fimbria pilin